jgi:hypothetical protein
MKQLILKIALFLFVIFLVEKPIGYLIANGAVNRQYDLRIHKLMQGEIESDIIILGSSRALNGVDAGALQQELGQFTVYNFGYSGSNLLFHQSIFQLITRVYIPKKIVLVIDDQNAFKQNEKAIYRRDKLYPFIQYDPVLAEVVQHSSKTYIPSKVSWLYRENQNMFEAINFYLKGPQEPDETTDVDDYGFIPLSNDQQKLNKLVDRSLSINYDLEDELPEYINSLMSIDEKCRELGIELYLLRLPSYNKKIEGFNDRLAEIVNDKTRLLDFSNRLIGEEFYYDNGHLSARGASEISLMLSKEIN